MRCLRKEGVILEAEGGRSNSSSDDRFRRRPKHCNVADSILWQPAVNHGMLQQVYRAIILRILTRFLARKIESDLIETNSYNCNDYLTTAQFSLSPSGNKSVGSWTIHGHSLLDFGRLHFMPVKPRLYYWKRRNPTASLCIYPEFESSQRIRHNSTGRSHCSETRRRGPHWHNIAWATDNLGRVSERSLSEGKCLLADRHC